MSYVRPSRIDLCEDFFVRVSKSLKQENVQTNYPSNRFAAENRPISILALSPRKPPSTASRSAFGSPRSWRGDEPISPPSEYWFPFFSRGVSPCRPYTAGDFVSTNIAETTTKSKRGSVKARLSNNRRVPNDKQLPRWKRREDPPWNPPTYIPQLTPGALPHFELESDLLRTPRSLSNRWKSLSATPRRLATAGTA